MFECWRRGGGLWAQGETRKANPFKGWVQGLPEMGGCKGGAARPIYFSFI